MKIHSLSGSDPYPPPLALREDENRGGIGNEIRRKTGVEKSKDRVKKGSSPLIIWRELLESYGGAIKWCLGDVCGALREEVRKIDRLSLLCYGCRSLGVKVYLDISLSSVHKKISYKSHSLSQKQNISICIYYFFASITRKIKEKNLKNFALVI